MMPDRANRSFLALTAIAMLVSAFSLWGGMAGVLEPMLRTRIGNDRGLATVAMLLVTPLVVVAATGTALACHTLARQTLASVKLSRRVRALRAPLPDRLAAAAAATGLRGRVVLVEASTPFSYAYRILSPRVVVSRGLLEALRDQELRAVLEHERYHVVNLDPLKLTIVRTIRAAMFMLPALDALQRSYLAGRELAADRRAVALCGRGPLTAALLKIVHDPEGEEMGVGAAIGGVALLGVRIRQLETGQEPRLRLITSTKLASSTLLLGVLAATFLAAVWALGGPANLTHATGTGLATALLLGGISCAVPFAVVGLLGYTAIALRARRPLPASGRTPDAESGV
jgi:Zn-dependent protease with chaperone function